MASKNSELLPSMMVDLNSPTPYTDAVTVSEVIFLDTKMYLLF